MRHIVNPHCNQDEGVRIVWPTPDGKGNDEVRDWSRRDMMIRDGKTVRPIIQVAEEDTGSGTLNEVPLPLHHITVKPSMPVWDNIGWTRLG